MQIIINLNHLLDELLGNNLCACAQRHRIIDNKIKRVKRKRENFQFFF